MRNRAGLERALGWVVAGIAIAEGLGGAPACRAAAPEVVECPVMREVVPDVKTAPRVEVNGKTLYFCCKTCPGKFREHPERYVGATVRDPISGKAFHPTAKSPRVEQPGKLFLFESRQTRAQFLRKKGPSGKAAPISSR